MPHIHLVAATQRLPIRPKRLTTYLPRKPDAPKTVAVMPLRGHAAFRSGALRKPWRLGNRPRPRSPPKCAAPATTRQTKGNYSFCKVGSTGGGGRPAPQVRRGRARHASSSRHVPCLRAQQSVCLIGRPQLSTPQARQRPLITLSLTMCGYPRARRSTGQSCLHRHPQRDHHAPNGGRRGWCATQAHFSACARCMDGEVCLTC